MLSQERDMLIVAFWFSSVGCWEVFISLVIKSNWKWKLYLRLLLNSESGGGNVFHKCKKERSSSAPISPAKEATHWTKHNKSFIGTFKKSWVSLGNLHQSKTIWLNFWLILTQVIYRQLFWLLQYLKKVPPTNFTILKSLQ